MLGSALLAKGRTVVRFLYTLQNLAADANGRLLSINLFDVKNAFGVVVPEFATQLVATFGNGADTAPFSIADLEYFVYEFLGDAIAFTANNASVRILNLGATFLELSNCHQNSVQQVKRFKPGDDDGYLKPSGDGFVFTKPHNGADVAGTQKALNPV